MKIAEVNFGLDLKIEKLDNSELNAIGGGAPKDFWAGFLFPFVFSCGSIYGVFSDRLDLRERIFSAGFSVGFFAFFIYFNYRGIDALLDIAGLMEAGGRIKEQKHKSERKSGGKDDSDKKGSNIALNV